MSQYRIEILTALFTKMFIVLFALGGLANVAEAASLQGIGDFEGGATISKAYGVSTDGKVVVGKSDSEEGMRAFRWTEESGLSQLGRLPGKVKESHASAVSADGSHVVGWWVGGKTRSKRSFLWTLEKGSVPLPIRVELGKDLTAEANAISDDGQTVVGNVQLGRGTAGFRWTKQGGTEILYRTVKMKFLGNVEAPSIALGVSGNGETVFGSVDYEGKDYAVFWHGELPQRIEVPGSPPWFKMQSVGVAASQDGTIATGRLRGGKRGQCGFVAKLAKQYDPVIGHYWLENESGLKMTWPNAMSSDGSTVVGIGEDKTWKGACVWDQNQGVRSILHILSESGVDTDGWKLKEATSVSADGKVIVGMGTNPVGKEEAWRVELP